MGFQLALALEVLQNTPRTLRSLLEGLSDPWTGGTVDPETWSPYDVVGHLIHGEETDWLPRLKIILEHGDTRPFEPFDRTAFFVKSRGRTLAMLLDTFAALREENLRAVQGLHLSPGDLDLKSMHPELGPVTLRQLLATWVVHDLGHLRQIVRTMAHHYDQAVGPWKAYLSILDERE